MFSILKIEQKAATFRELATMVKAGMSLSESLGVLEGRRTYRSLKQAMGDAAYRVADGTRLSKVLADYPREFSPVTLGVLTAGEESGKLEEALEKVAGFLEREYGLRQMISQETFYPKVLGVAAILIPNASQAIVTGIQESFWAGVGVFVRGLATYAVILGIPALLVYVVYRVVTSTDQGRYFVDSVKLRVPLLGPVVRRLALAKFSRALAHTYGGGVPFAQAVALAGSVTGNAAISRRLVASIPHLRQGGKLSEVLRDSPDIDDMVVRMVATGEQTGNLDDTMEWMAEHFEIACESSIRRMVAVALPVGVVIMAIIIGVILVNFYLYSYASFLLE